VRLHGGLKLGVVAGLLAAATVHVVLMSGGRSASTAGGDRSADQSMPKAVVETPPAVVVASTQPTLSSPPTKAAPSAASLSHPHPQPAAARPKPSALSHHTRWTPQGPPPRPPPWTPRETSPTVPQPSSPLPSVPLPSGSSSTGPSGPNGPTTYPPDSSGYDISWPECGHAYPQAPYTITVVGASGGWAFTTNPCLASEASWAGRNLELYLNVNSPQSIDPQGSDGAAGHCSAGDHGCQAYNYGYNDGIQALSNAAGQGVRARTWWLDVETAGDCAPQFPTGGTGYWSCDHKLNAWTIQGAIDALRARGQVVGIYSTQLQWGVITGGYVPPGNPAPTWIAGADSSEPRSWCTTTYSFANGTPWMVQLGSGSPYDQDRSC